MITLLVATNIGSLSADMFEYNVRRRGVGAAYAKCAAANGTWIDGRVCIRYEVVTFDVAASHAGETRRMIEALAALSDVRIIVSIVNDVDECACAHVVVASAFDWSEHGAKSLGQCECTFNTCHYCSARSLATSRGQSPSLLPTTRQVASLRADL